MVAANSMMLKDVSSLIPKEKVETTEPKNVLAKMMIKAQGDELIDVVSNILGVYGTEDLTLTFMLERG